MIELKVSELTSQISNLELFANARIIIIFPAMVFVERPKWKVEEVGMESCAKVFLALMSMCSFLSLINFGLPVEPEVLTVIVSSLFSHSFRKVSIDFLRL